MNKNNKIDRYNDAIVLLYGKNGSGNCHALIRYAAAIKALGQGVENVCIRTS
jgi:hypothetical protein